MDTATAESEDREFTPKEQGKAPARFLEWCGCPSV
jgi:hypothetical protein